MSREYDVVVVGGGPAGSTTAALAARDGHRVALIEKQSFPRYQIGESLWIATWPIFDALEVSPALRAAGFFEKRGGTFYWGPFAAPWSIYFAEDDGSVASSFHVDRATFDSILLDRARSLGVDIIHGAVDQLLKEDGRVCGASVSSGGNGFTARGRFIVDASGMYSRLAPTPIDVQRPGAYTSAAIWSYFSDVEHPAPPNETNVVTVAFRYGWFWFIPLRGGTTSVGAVIDQALVPRSSHEHEKALGAEFSSAVASSPIAVQMLRGAKRAEPFRARLFAPRNLSTYYAEGFLAVGDAACFIDPVFSTGVHLGMSGACFAGYALNTILRGGREDLALQAFERNYRADYTALRSMTEELFAINAAEPNAYWQTRQAMLDGQRRQRVADTVASLRHIGGLHDNQAAIAHFQLRMAQELDAKYGLGRFRGVEFMDRSLSLVEGGAEIHDGYAMPDATTRQFRPAKLIATPRCGAREVSEPDLELFRLCGARPTVRDLIASLRGHFDLSAFGNSDLAEMIGAWVDAGVLAPAD